MTLDQLIAACSTSSAHASLWLDALNAAMAQFAINAPARQAAFLAQITVESAHLSAVSENLNYGAQGLLTTFPHEFTAQEALTYARHPEAIANRAYANRGGNGDESSGDGWKYRGRGPIQLTFHDNYVAKRDRLRAIVGGTVPDFEADPDQVETPQWGAMCAALYWADAGCNELADKGAFDAITRAINGPGMAGADLRRTQWAIAKSALGVAS